METFDVIVIGAGPAGGSTALHAAKAGLSTLVLEEHPEIGVPVHCGECLSDIAVTKMGVELPDSVISKRVDGVKIVFPNKKFSILYEKGYVLEKHLWEQWIAKLAKEAGAKIAVQSKVTAMERVAEGWKITVNENTEIYGKVVIDATGPACISSRLLELNPRPKMVTGFQYEIEDIPQENFLDFYLWPRLAPEGYLWMIPKSNGRANVGLVTTEIPKAKVNTDIFIEEMGWQDKKKVKPFGGPIPESGPVQNTYAERLMLVGDAAGFTSPMFEGGSHLGLVSGKFAARVAQDAIAKNNFTKEFFSRYEQLWQKEFPVYKKIIDGKKAFYNFNEQEMNQIAGLLPENLTTMGKMKKAGIGLELLMKYRHLLSKNVLTAFNALGYSQAQHYGW